MNVPEFVESKVMDFGTNDWIVKGGTPGATTPTGGKPIKGNTIPG